MPTAEHVRQINARNRMRYAVKHGKLIKPDRCSSCGEIDRPNQLGLTRLQGHHHNGYDDALDVVWLCSRCHMKITPRHDLTGHSMNVGQKNGRAKISDNDVKEIRSNNQSNRMLGKKYGVCEKTIRSIKKREIWAHVE